MVLFTIEWNLIINEIIYGGFTVINQMSISKIQFFLFCVSHKSYAQNDVKMISRKWLINSMIVSGFQLPNFKIMNL